jgi:hypothetical protein
MYSAPDVACYSRALPNKALNQMVASLPLVSASVMRTSSMKATRRR